MSHETVSRANESEEILERRKILLVASGISVGGKAAFFAAGAIAGSQPDIYGALGAASIFVAAVSAEIASAELFGGLQKHTQPLKSA